MLFRSYYIIEPFIAGRKANLFGIDLDLSPYRNVVFYVFSGLTLITVLISLFAPAVGNFEKDLQANGLSQAQTKMKLTRANAEHSQATSFGVNKGVTSEPAKIVKTILHDAKEGTDNDFQHCVINNKACQQSDNYGNRL